MIRHLLRLCIGSCVHIWPTELLSLLCTSPVKIFYQSVFSSGSQHQDIGGLYRGTLCWAFSQDISGVRRGFYSTTHLLRICVYCIPQSAAHVSSCTCRHAGCLASRLTTGVHMHSSAARDKGPLGFSKFMIVMLVITRSTCTVLHQGGSLRCICHSDNQGQHQYGKFLPIHLLLLSGFMDAGLVA